MVGKGTGPDLAIVGAARSGTSHLAAHLSEHPQIDASAVKEPNYFSRHFDRGPEWYEGYFRPRAPGLLRLDASVSHTFPQFPEALARLAQASPSAYVVYVVRDPIPRTVSHYHYYRYYFANEQAPDFGAALRRGDDYYLGVSDYRRWLDSLVDSFPRDRVLVVPFAAVTRSSAAVAEVVCEQLGIDPPPAAEKQADAHRNNAVVFRSEVARRATRTLRRSRFYPAVRRGLGAGTLRSIRALVTTDPRAPSVEEALASCTDAERARLEELDVSARAAVADWLDAQDVRLGLTWADDWSRARQET